MALLADKSDSLSECVMKDFITVPQVSQDQKQYWQFSIPEHQLHLIPSSVSNTIHSKYPPSNTPKEITKHRVRTSSIKDTSTLLTTPIIPEVSITESEENKPESAGYCLHYFILILSIFIHSSLEHHITLITLLIKNSLP